MNKDTIYIVDEDKIHSGVHLVDRDSKEKLNNESDVEKNKLDENLEKKQESDKKDSKKESKDK